MIPSPAAALTGHNYLGPLITLSAFDFNWMVVSWFGGRYLGYSWIEEE